MEGVPAQGEDPDFSQHCYVSIYRVYHALRRLTPLAATGLRCRSLTMSSDCL